MARWLLALCLVLTVAIWPRPQAPDPRPAAPAPGPVVHFAGAAVETVPGDVSPVPWQSVSEIPPGAWFRGLPPAHLRDTRRWCQVSAVEPDGVVIDGSWFPPAELLGRFEMTFNPLADSPQVRPCGR